MDNFAREPAKDRDEAFQEAAARLGLSKMIMEKDFWVVWTLKKLFDLPSFGGHLIFKGGTSLSKAYDAIYRFSEDVDLSLDRAQLGFSGERDPENPTLSSGRRKTLLKELQDEAEKTVAGPLLDELQHAMNESLAAEVDLVIDPDDAQTLLFRYPSADNLHPTTYVQPIIRLEFGARGVQFPAEPKTVKPYLTTAIPDLLEATEVTAKVLAVERTFWEKATILHMLYHQDITKPLADRMSRHYYDLGMLIVHEAKQRALNSLALLEEVAHHKSVFFKAAWANYDTARPGSLRLVPNPNLEAALRRDYVGMREMIIGEAPSFDDILQRIRTLETEVNG